MFWRLHVTGHTADRSDGRNEANRSRRPHAGARNYPRRAGGAGKRGSGGGSALRALASKAMPVSRSTGRSHPARLRGDAVAARTGTDGTSHWVLTTRTRHRPKVLLTISTSVCSTATGACWEGAEADRVRWRPRLHHHQPRRAASGAVASKTVATRARLSGRGAGPTSSATRGRLGAFFNLGQMVPIGNRQRAPRRIAPRCWPRALRRGLDRELSPPPRELALAPPSPPVSRSLPWSGWWGSMRRQSPPRDCSR